MTRLRLESALWIVGLLALALYCCAPGGPQASEPSDWDGDVCAETDAGCAGDVWDGEQWVAP